MNPLECQIYHKALKLARRKQKRFREFENFLVEDEYINLIYALDEQEEDLNDALLFCGPEGSKLFEDTYFKEIQELEEQKDRISSHFEGKILEYENLSGEEALMELQEFIKNSKAHAIDYFVNFKISINRLLRKLTVIKHILFVENHMKKINCNVLNIKRNSKNLPNIITVDNANKILISNIVKLKNSVEEKFQNLMQLFDKFGEDRMNPYNTENVDLKCPSLSSSSDSSNEECYSDKSSVNDGSQEDVQKTSDCFFVEHSLMNTRVDSIEKLKIDASQLQEQIETIQNEKARINRKIEEKKSEIFEALSKVAEFEDNIVEIELLIADQLYNFQQRLISLETKLMNNFLGENDADIKNLLDNEINLLKESFHEQSIADERNRNELIQQAQRFATTIGDIVSDIQKFCSSEEINEKITENIKKLQNLLERPAQYCHDSKGRRFYFNTSRTKIFQDEYHTSHYKLDNDGAEILIKEGFPIETDENGEFYVDSKERKIYTKYYFEDDFGRYFIDVHGDRHYKTDSEASEYMLVNGIWVKTKEGVYERDEKGMRVKPALEQNETEENDNDEMEDVIDEKNFESTSGEKHKITSDDMKYIKETVGPAIIKACAATYLHKPSDPLVYFANFLLHYRYTEKMFEARDRELNYFIELRKQMRQNCDEKN